MVQKYPLLLLLPPPPPPLSSPMANILQISKNRHVVRKLSIQHHRQPQILIWQVLVIEQPRRTVTGAIHHRQVVILNNVAQNIYHNHINYHHHHHRRPLHHPCVNSFLMRLVHGTNQSVSMCDVCLRVKKMQKISTHLLIICINAHVRA